MKRIWLMAIMLTSACYSSSDWQTAERFAKEYAKKIPGSTGEIECSHRDTNKDGYCSCTVFMSQGEVTPIECGCPSTAFGAGCVSEQVTGCKMVVRGLMRIQGDYPQ